MTKRIAGVGKGKAKDVLTYLNNEHRKNYDPELETFLHSMKELTEVERLRLFGYLVAGMFTLLAEAREREEHRQVMSEAVSQLLKKQSTH